MKYFTRTMCVVFFQPGETMYAIHRLFYKLKKPLSGKGFLVGYTFTNSSE